MNTFKLARDDATMPMPTSADEPDPDGTGTDAGDRVITAVTPAVVDEPIVVGEQQVAAGGLAAAEPSTPSGVTWSGSDTSGGGGAEPSMAGVATSGREGSGTTGRAAKVGVVIGGIVVGAGLVAGIIWGLDTVPEDAETPLDTQSTTSQTDADPGNALPVVEPPPEQAGRLPRNESPRPPAAPPAGRPQADPRPAGPLAGSPDRYRYPPPANGPELAPPPGGQPPPGGELDYSPAPEGSSAPGGSFDDPYANGSGSAPPARSGPDARRDGAADNARDNDRSARPLDSITPGDEPDDRRPRREPLGDVPELGGLGGGR